jgi:hypothetical protein
MGDVPGTVGEVQSRFEQATAGLDGRSPMPANDARALLERAGGHQPPEDLIGDRAEALLQLNAALSHMASLVPPETDGSGSDDSSALRAAAKVVATARIDLAQAEKALSWLETADPARLEAARLALDEATLARDDLHPARTRVTGSLISATGMTIAVAALGWPAWAYLVPTQLMLLTTADLQVAGATTRKASRRVAQEMAAAGVAGEEGLERAWAAVRDREAAEERVERRRRQVAEAQARWDELAPGRDPEEVEVLIQRRLGAAPVDAATARTRLLAEMLLDEARADLNRVDAALRDVENVEHARRSMEWWAARAALNAGT